DFGGDAGGGVDAVEDGAVDLVGDVGLFAERTRADEGGGGGGGDGREGTGVGEVERAEFVGPVVDAEGGGAFAPTAEGLERAARSGPGCGRREAGAGFLGLGRRSPAESGQEEGQREGVA